MPEITKKVSAKDFFMQLGAMVALYASAISFTMLIFEYINVLHPDPLGIGGYYDTYGSFRSIRWSISLLIVVFPLYVWLSWFLEKSYKKHPEHRKIWIRRWLTYLTLFIAAGIIIGNFVTLIYNGLGGELTMRFILKVITMFFVTGSVFGYYLWNIKKHQDD
ncbi:MAG: DUF5671 domain-containing protein [Patescibacteria group bacterium]